MTNVFENIKEEVMGIFDKHAGEVETALADTAAATDSPLGVDVATLVHIPPASLRAFGVWLVHLDTDLAGKAAAEKQAADPTAGSATTTATGPDATSPDAAAPGPAEVSIPAQPTAPYQN